MRDFQHISSQMPSISLSVSGDLVSLEISELSGLGSDMSARLVLLLGAQRSLESRDQALATALITNC